MRVVSTDANLYLMIHKFLPLMSGAEGGNVRSSVQMHVKIITLDTCRFITPTMDAIKAMTCDSQDEAGNLKVRLQIQHSRDQLNMFIFAYDSTTLPHVVKLRKFLDDGHTITGDSKDATEEHGYTPKETEAMREKMVDRRMDFIDYVTKTRRSGGKETKKSTVPI